MAKELLRKRGRVTGVNEAGPDQVTIQVNEQQHNEEGRVVGMLSLGSFRFANEEAPRVNSYVDIIITEAEAPLPSPSSSRGGRSSAAPTS